MKAVKKETAMLAHRDIKRARKIRIGYALATAFSLSQLIRQLEYIACQTGCLFAVFFAFEFFFAPIDPGIMSLTAGWTLAAVSGWLALTLGRLAGELGGNQK